MDDSIRQALIVVGTAFGTCVATTLGGYFGFMVPSAEERQGKTDTAIMWCMDELVECRSKETRDGR